MEQIAWFLDYTGNRWRFSTEPNANNIVDPRPRRTSRTPGQRGARGPDPTRVPDGRLVEAIHFPTGPAGVKDEAKLRLVVMHHDDLTVVGAAATPPPSKIVEILDRHGRPKASASSATRVFLVADADGVDAMRERIRHDLAADADHL